MATTSTQRFHPNRCGENISLSDNNTVARRVRRYCYGIVFTEQPVALGKVFQVKILGYGDSRILALVLGSIVSIKLTIIIIIVYMYYAE